MKLTVTHIIVSVCLTLICSALLMGADFMYWESDFDPIALPNITTQDATPEGNAQVTLFISGNTEISADNTATAQLSSGTDTLPTEYKLNFDGDGIANTGGSTVPFTSYDSFLSTPAYVTHVTDDNDVNVTLSVKASNYAGEVANAGAYSATQTLTAHWVGP